MSNNLIHLTENDFFVSETNNNKNNSTKNVLCCNLRNVALVLFYARQCIHCNETLPVFQILPKAVPSCQFALLNVEKNMKVAQMSADTICPVEFVPFLVLFVNGRPFMKYTGPKTVQDISSFLNDVLSRLQQRKQFSNLKVENSEHEIPPYSYGVPFNLICEGEQCYLSFNEAYKRPR